MKLLLPRFWYRRGFSSYLLAPLAFIYGIAAICRRSYYKIFRGKKLGVPIVVVGNITVGGAGKTPLVIHLVNLLRGDGYRVGVVSRGYGRKNRNTLAVTEGSLVADVGDEPLLIFNKTKAVVVVGKHRVDAADVAISLGCNVIISDDGLQHYALERDVEIVVVDHGFRFGNGFYLPAGPLRESVARLRTVDFIIENFNTASGISVDNFSGDGFWLEVLGFRNMSHGTLCQDIDFFRDKAIHAVAAIGRPEKFFDTLDTLGLSFRKSVFPDHHEFKVGDFFSGTEEMVVMTEKDSVKCKVLARENFWCLEVKVHMVGDFDLRLLKKLRGYNLEKQNFN